MLAIREGGGVIEWCRVGECQYCCFVEAKGSVKWVSADIATVLMHKGIGEWVHINITAEAQGCC